MQPALLMALIAVSYVLLGGGPGWTLPPVWTVALLAALVAPRRTFGFPRHTRPLDLALLALLGAVAVQLIPLPPALVATLSPHALPLRAATSLAVAAPASWVPLSIDPAATARALGTLALSILVLWTARGLFSAGGSTRKFCRALGWLAAVAAVVAIVQRTVRPGLLMGVVVTDARNANPMGPFLNRNHFAAWLLLAAAASIGYLIAHLQIHPAYRGRFRVAFSRFLASGALLSGVCAVIVIGTLLLTLSRSAAAGLGAAAMSGAWLAWPRLRIERTSVPRALALVGIALLLLVATIDVEGWFTRLQQSLGLADSDFDRLTIWGESLPMVRDFFFTGTGAGTYGLAMADYQQSRFWIGAMQGWAHFNNAHSHYVQLACEGGLLLVVPAATAGVLLARLGVEAIRSDKGEMFWVRIGAAAGLVGLAVQSIWEVALIMPANAILCATLAGLLLYRRDAVRAPTPTDLRSA